MTYESTELVAVPGLTLFVYTTQPGSKSEQALNLLASWTAAPDEEITDADLEEQPRDTSRAEQRILWLRLPRHRDGFKDRHLPPVATSCDRWAP